MTKPIILSEEQIQTQIKNLNGWTVSDNKLRKEFSFEDFMDSLNFVVKLAPFFEENDHHPDIYIFYSKIIFELQRFDVGGKITDKDFTVAQEIQKEYREKNSNKL
jgi:4a-hydroxytetrahydrobiopterin dehydratase